MIHVLKTTSATVPGNVRVHAPADFVATARVAN